MVSVTHTYKMSLRNNFRLVVESREVVEIKDIKDLSDVIEDEYIGMPLGVLNRTIRTAFPNARTRVLAPRTFA